MGIKAIFLMFIILVVYLMQQSDAFPRASVVAKAEKLKLNGVSSTTVKVGPRNVGNYDSDIKIPRRINCSYDEATEDVVCQEHCLQKGYSYGLCVKRTCSCI